MRGRPKGSKNVKHPERSRAFIHQSRIAQKYLPFKFECNQELIRRLCIVLEIDYEKYRLYGTIVSLWEFESI